jgi:putative ABC transport system substrate-binding protein
MRRRAFIALLAGNALCPHLVVAQQANRVRRVGVLMALNESDPDGKARIEAFQRGLQSLGWTQGGNLQIEYRWAAGKAEHFRGYAAELAKFEPDVVVAHTSIAVDALRREVPTTPIVFVTVVDPVRLGFVSSLAHPGGNMTGFTNVETSLQGKWLSMLREVAPQVTRVAIIFHPGTTAFAQTAHLVEAAASSYGLTAAVTPIQDLEQLEGTVATLARESGTGLLFLPDSFLSSNRERVIDFVSRHRLPAIYTSRHFAVDGGLMSYGIDNVYQMGQAAIYVDRILRGAKPGDLPVQQPAKYEFVVNLKAANALGLTIPSLILASADEVIE